jgi:micrococcal nuclease
MRGRVRVLIAGLLAAVALSFTACGSDTEFTPLPAEPYPGLTMPADAQGPFPVDRVVDGDTVRVLINGESTPVRLIGIDTPETVAPNRPVECAGPEASVYADQLMTGGRVYLEIDPTQGVTDRFDRVLAYVWLDDNVMVNLAMLQTGLAEERTYAADYKYQQLFQQEEKRAKDALLGLWGQIC